MDTTRYAAFVAAAETKSMSGAAKRLGYTPSGIVRLVNALESDLGFSVLTRASSGVTLTPEGEKLLPIFKEVLRYEERAEQTSARIRGMAEGALTIGIQADVAPDWLMQFVRFYRERFPDVACTFVEEGKDMLVSLLQASELDCCFVHGKPEGCKWVKLADREVVACVADSSSLTENPSLLLAELQEQPLAVAAPVYESLPPNFTKRVDELCDSSFKLKSASMVMQSVREGMAHALMVEGSDLAFAHGVQTRPLSPRRFVEFGMAVFEGPAMSPAVAELETAALDFSKRLPVVRTEEA